MEQYRSVLSVEVVYGGLVIGGALNRGEQDAQ